MSKFIKDFQINIKWKMGGGNLKKIKVLGVNSRHTAPRSYTKKVSNSVW